MYDELLELYDKLSEHNIVAPPAHTTITPKIGILLGESGNFMGAMYLNETAIVPCTEQSECRTSNIAPHLIHDNLSYVGNINGYENRFSAYVAQLGEYVSQVDDKLAHAVYSHVKTGLLLDELKPITNCIPYPLERISVVFAIPGIDTTINHSWEKYYISRLPINGMCPITGEAAYIPKTYPQNLRKQGDRAKLFQGTSKIQFGDYPPCSPGYVTAQKICHTIQWLTTSSDTIVGDERGPLANYVPLKEYAKLKGVNPANVRQKILRGTLESKKFGSEWFLDINTPYNDARKTKTN